MKVDYETLLFRIKDDPKAHLGRCDVHLIDPYFLGYGEARRAWQQSPVPRRLDLERFLSWQDTKVHLCNKNLQSFCGLLTDSDEDAFELFFTLYDAALSECAADLVDHAFEIEQLTHTARISYSLIDSVLVPALRKRPAMYFGNRNWIGSLWTMCNGFLWAEKDMGVMNSNTATKLGNFQAWLDIRHPIGKGRNWWQLFDFLALGSREGALERFFEELELFLEDKPADTPSKWVTEVMANFLAERKDPEEESDR